ncbi:hypothetical protein DPV78_011131 [Talaromyces pinophilus]|nr:hypothetical protein DPV78_011131 [Talaromyces pinophilus]
MARISDSKSKVEALSSRWTSAMLQQHLVDESFRKLPVGIQSPECAECLGRLRIVFCGITPPPLNDPTSLNGYEIYQNASQLSFP